MTKKAVAEVVKIYTAHHWYRNPETITSVAEDVFGHHPEWVELERDHFSRMPRCPHTEDLPYTRSGHSNMPSLVAVGRHWQENQMEALHSFGPHVWTVLAGRGSCCFGCLQPARDCSVRDDFRTGGFERAHLQDCCLGGANRVENLVPLCSVCHWQMTANFTGCRSCAVTWIRWQQRPEARGERG